VHPALTMAVAWIPGRNDTLLTLFALAFFIQLRQYVGTKHTKHLILQALFLMCALFTKETAVFIPFVAALFVWALGKKLLDKGNLLLYATWLPLGLVWFVLRSRILDRSQDVRSVGETVSDAVSRLPAYLVYIGKAVLPFNLSVFPSLDNEVIWFGLLAAALIGMLIWFSLKSSSRNTNEVQQTAFHHQLRMMLLGLGWFAVFITPFLLVPKNVNDQVFEHRLYLPMVGLLIVLAHTVLFNGEWKLNKTIIEAPWWELYS
jgi:uncharacterized membrane protein